MSKKKWYSGLTKGTLARRGGCGAEVLGASTALWATVVLTARIVACGGGGLSGDRSSFGYQSKNMVSSQRLLGIMNAWRDGCCVLGDRVRGCAKGTNFEPLISVERAVLANPPDCSRCFWRLNHNRLTGNGKHHQDRGR